MCMCAYVCAERTLISKKAVTWCLILQTAWHIAPALTLFQNRATLKIGPYMWCSQMLLSEKLSHPSAHHTKHKMATTSTDLTLLLENWDRFNLIGHRFITKKKAGEWIRKGGKISQCKKVEALTNKKLATFLPLSQNNLLGSWHRWRHLLQLLWLPIT